MNFSFSNKILIFLVRYFRFVLIGVIIILLFFSYLLLIKPKFLEIQEQGGLDYKSKIEILDAKKKELAQLKELEQNLSQITSVEMEKLEKILPTSKQLPDIYVQMENLARDSGLAVTSISIAEGEQVTSSGDVTSLGVAQDNKQAQAATKKTGPIGALTISLSVQGDSTYSALKTFLDNIEDNMRLVDVNSLNYASSQGEQKSYTINLKTYYLTK